MYALVRNNTILKQQTTLPESETLISDPGTWVTGLQYKSVEVQRSTGWYEIIETTRPTNTATDTFDRTLSWNGSEVTETWVQRSKTAAELESERLAVNSIEIEQAIVNAISQLDTLIAAPAVPTVASGTLSTAQLSNSLRTMRDVIQQNRTGIQDAALILKRTIKLVRGDYDTVN